MKDFIQRGSGDSRFLKSSLPPETSWAQALALLRAGEFPIDLAGMNPAGWLQLGTLLSKANLLRDETAEDLGLTAEAVPDDAFRAIKGLIEQASDRAEELAAQAAALATASITVPAAETTKAGDIVDIIGGKASHNFVFGGGTRTKVFDIAAKSYPEGFTMLSATRAVRVKGATVYLYQVTDKQFTQIASQTLNGGRSLGSPIKISDTEFFCINRDWFEDSESDDGGYYSNQRYSYVKISGTTISITQTMLSYPVQSYVPTYLVKVPGERKFIGAYGDTSYSSWMPYYITTCTIAADGTASWSYDNGSTGRPGASISAICGVDSDTVLCAIRGGTDAGTTTASRYGVYLNFIGTDATSKGSTVIPQLLGTGEQVSGYQIIPFSSSKLLIILKDGRALIATRSGTSFTFGDEFSVYDGSFQEIRGVMVNSSTIALAILRDSGLAVRTVSSTGRLFPVSVVDTTPELYSISMSSGGGKTILSYTVGRDNAQSRPQYVLIIGQENQATEGIAMHDAAANVPVKVALDGNIALASLKRGQQLRAYDGQAVGHCYADGLVNVIGKWKRAGTIVPAGTVVMWSGSILDIKPGWVLCDGQNGTPDLRDIFVLGAGGSKNPGDHSAGSTGQIRTDTEGIASSVIGGHGYQQFVTAVYAEADSVPYYALAFIMKL